MDMTGPEQLADCDVAAMEREDETDAFICTDVFWQRTPPVARRKAAKNIRRLFSGSKKEVDRVMAALATMRVGGS
jgi:hypothetical protein